MGADALLPAVGEERAECWKAGGDDTEADLEGTVVGDRGEVALEGGSQQLAWMCSAGLTR